MSSIRQGARIAKSVDGNVPFIQGRDLTISGLTVDDLGMGRPKDSQSTCYAQAGDVLLQRIGQKQKAFLVEEELAGVLVGDTIYAIRFHKDDRLRARYLVKFLNSEVGQARLSSTSIGGVVIPTLRITHLRRLRVPIPNLAVMELIEDLHRVELSLVERISKARHLRQRLFNLENSEQFNRQLRDLSTEAQVLSESLFQADDSNFQIRNYYPYLLAYAYRALDAIDNNARLYMEQLRIAENLLAFLGSLGLATLVSMGPLSNNYQAAFSVKALQDYWQMGITPDAWLDIAKSSAKLLGENEHFAAVTSFANLWFKGKGAKQSEFARLIHELVERKNDFKHDRGPKNEHEYHDAVQSIGDQLRKCLQEIAFFIHLVGRVWIIIGRADSPFSNECRLLSSTFAESSFELSN